ncbi:unnamed protein product [Amoebophrya sp. A25]|nr:unnamed protein product [Amoebophrya sp. A25]|eukprot:GSA25T00027018001.1
MMQMQRPDKMASVHFVSLVIVVAYLCSGPGVHAVRLRGAPTSRTSAKPGTSQEVGDHTSSKSGGKPGTNQQVGDHTSSKSGGKATKSSRRNRTKSHPSSTSSTTVIPAGGAAGDSPSITTGANGGLDKDACMLTDADAVDLPRGCSSSSTYISTPDDVELEHPAPVAAAGLVHAIIPDDDPVPGEPPSSASSHSILETSQAQASCRSTSPHHGLASPTRNATSCSPSSSGSVQSAFCGSAACDVVEVDQELARLDLNREDDPEDKGTLREDLVVPERTATMKSSSISSCSTATSSSSSGRTSNSSSSSEIVPRTSEDNIGESQEPSSSSSSSSLVPAASSSSTGDRRRSAHRQIKKGSATLMTTAEQSQSLSLPIATKTSRNPRKLPKSCIRAKLSPKPKEPRDGEGSRTRRVSFEADHLEEESPQYCVISGPSWAAYEATRLENRYKKAMDRLRRVELERETRRSVSFNTVPPLSTGSGSGSGPASATTPPPAIVRYDLTTKTKQVLQEPSSDSDVVDDAFDDQQQQQQQNRGTSPDESDSDQIGKDFSHVELAVGKRSMKGKELQLRVNKALWKLEKIDKDVETLIGILYGNPAFEEQMHKYPQARYARNLKLSPTAAEDKQVVLHRLEQLRLQAASQIDQRCSVGKVMLKEGGKSLRNLACNFANLFLPI